MAIEIKAIFTGRFTYPTSERISVVRVEAIVKKVKGAILEDNFTVLTLEDFPLCEQIIHQGVVFRLVVIQSRGAIRCVEIHQGDLADVFHILRWTVGRCADSRGTGL